MHSISGVLDRVLKKLDLDQILIQASIFKQWDDIVGPSIAAHARPDHMRANKLFVQVDSSVWLQELTLLKPSLLEKTNAALGGERVRDLVFRLAYQTAPVSRNTDTPSTDPGLGSGRALL